VPTTLDIYSSLPLHGLARGHSLALENGIRLALAQAHGRAGRFTIHYIALDDSTASAGQWDPTQTATDARKAAQDPRAVYYIGEFDSDASKISIPILNHAEVPQVSPASTYVGLTTHDPGSVAGEPRMYYPIGRRTFLRLVPRDTIQAEAAVMTMKHDGCSKVAMVSDGTSYGAGLGALIESRKNAFALAVTASGVPSGAGRAYAQAIKAKHVDCFFFAGVASPEAVDITKDVALAIPHLKIYGGDRLCSRSYTGELPPEIAAAVQCTRLTRPLTAYPGGRRFLAAYKSMYGTSGPDPWAIYGYESMRLGLTTIARLGAVGNDKSAILSALFAIQARQSVLGTYGFDAGGDTTLNAYGLYKVAAAGVPVFERTVTPP
jgi:branched-chain amino acid transport system substrate-binding protein